MIQVKNSVQLNAMKEAGRITGETLLVARELVQPGISTKQLDDANGMSTQTQQTQVY